MFNVVALALIVLAVAASTFLGFDLERAGQPSFALVACGPTVVLAVVAVLRARRDGVLKDWFGFRGGDFTVGFLTAAALFGATWLFTRQTMGRGTARESWLARLYLQMGDPTVLRKHVAWVVVAVVIMSVAEELVWRGLVISLLEEKVGSRRAWVYAPVLYAVAHIPSAWALRDPVAGLNPLLPLGALVCGLAWSYMFRRLGRLTPGMFSHGLFDWGVVMMFRLWGPSL